MARLGGSGFFAGFGDEAEEEVEAFFDFGEAEEGVAGLGVADEVAGDEIDEVVWVGEFGELGGELAAVVGGLLDETDDALEEVLAFAGGGGGVFAEGGDWFDAGDAEGFVLVPGEEADALQALEDEVGGAVGLGDAGSDDGGGAEFTDAGVLFESVLVVARLEAADAEEAVGLEGALEHGAVAWLEDVEGEEAVGEDVALGEQHHGDGGGKSHRKKRGLV